jgi:hypothetical protein
MNLEDLTPEELQKLLQRAIKQKQYHRKHYWEKKHGKTLDFANCRQVTIRNTTLCKGVSPVGYGGRDRAIYFENGDKTYGVEGWYVRYQGRSDYRHVAYAEELFEADISDFAWGLVDPGVVPETVLQHRSVAQVARRSLVTIACDRFAQYYFSETLENLPLGELMRKPKKKDVSAGRIYHLEDVFTLCFEGINVLALNGWDDLTEPISSIIARGRLGIAIIEDKTNEIARRARWLRDRVAEHFGFKGTMDGETFIKGPVLINHLGQVYIKNNYICIVPVSTGHGHDDFPTDDIVAAKMAAIATSERYRIHTLVKYEKLLEELFDEPKRKRGPSAN